MQEHQLEDGLTITHLISDVNLNTDIYVSNFNLANLTSEASSYYSYTISSGSSILQLSQSRTELDRHTETYNIGNNALVTHMYKIYVNVHAYDPSLGCVKDMSLLNAAVVYDCSHTCMVLIPKSIKLFRLKTCLIICCLLCN